MIRAGDADLMSSLSRRWLRHRVYKIRCPFVVTGARWRRGSQAKGTWTLSSAASEADHWSRRQGGQVVTEPLGVLRPCRPYRFEWRMNDTERRTGEQGGAYIGGRWVSADELRARGRRVADALARAAEGRDDVGTCPNCGERRPGAVDGPGGSLFVLGSECSACGHVEAMDGSDS